MTKTKKENKKKFVLVLLIVLLLALAVGYAAFSDILTISGTANLASDASFDLIFVEDDSANNITGCAIVQSQGINTSTSGVSISDDTLTVHINDLAYPGAGAQVRVVIKNNGSIPAKLSSLTPTNISGNTNAIVITGLNAYAANEKIAAGETCTVTFTVQWDPTKDIDNTKAGENGNDFSFGLQLNYDQDTTNFAPTNANSHT